MSRHVTFRHNELISSVRVSIRWKTKMFKAKSIGIQIFLKPLTETALSWNRCPELLKDPSTRGPKLRPFSRWVSSTRVFFCIILRICLHCHFQNHLFVSFRPWIRTFLKPHFFIRWFVWMLSSSVLECILKTMWFWCRDSLVSCGGKADSFK